MTGYASKKAAANAKLQCQCSMTTRLVGSGCEYCNPEYLYDDDAQPEQERQWIWLSDADIAEVIDTTCQYEGSYEEYLIKKAERKIRSMNNG